MDQKKTGNFIASRRKENGLTQSQLAEKLGITDKAVSKWETGRSLPDLSLFQPLCGLLGITLNELLAGELIADENLKEKSEQILLDVITGWLGKDPWTNETNADAPVILKIKNIRKVYETEHSAVEAVKDVRNDLAAFRRKHLGFVFQDYNLLDTLTVYENIALALIIKQMPKKSVKQTIKDLADQLGISDILDQFPYEISGGQRQRCACVRAIAANPSLILADEPTGALDSHSAAQLLEIFVMLRQKYDATILMVTHDALSASYCDKILFMLDGEIKASLIRDHESKQAFFTKILDTIATLSKGVTKAFIAEQN